MRFLNKFFLFLVLTLAAFSAAHAQDSGFRIRPGDVLQITVWKEDGLDRETLVLPDGFITFPLIGTLRAYGLSLPTLQTQITEKLKAFIPDANVTVTVKAPLGHTVSVLGQVAKPGELMIGRRMSVMQALSQSGGLTPFASEGKIIVIRTIKGKKTSIEFPYDSIAKGRELDKDIDLMPGDVVFVPTAGLL